MIPIYVLLYSTIGDKAAANLIVRDQSKTARGLGPNSSCLPNQPYVCSRMDTAMVEESRGSLLKVSVVTACFNSADTIRETIESLLKQTHQNFEHIIVDGRSSDETLRIIAEYQARYDGRLTVISERDTGLYDAMNKGVMLAKGDVIGLLNSDDVYFDDSVLSQITAHFADDIDGIFGNLIFCDKETMSKPLRVMKGKGDFRLGWVPPHPTLYVRKPVYEKHGSYRTDLRIASDLDFMVKILTDQSLKLYFIDNFLVKMRIGGESTNGMRGYIKSLEESHLVLKQNGIKHPVIFNVCRMFRLMGQKVSV